MHAIKWTAAKIKALKGKPPFACLTAYDYMTARMIDEGGLPLVLVGDSLGMVVLGYETTLPVTMVQMLHHTAAVTRGVKSALVVADMPFLSYHVSVQQALANAGRFIKSAGAGAVKIEGGALRAPTVKALTENGIPVMGHIGLTPQSICALGGYKIAGRRPVEIRRLVSDAKALEKAGAFALVLECMPPETARKITAMVNIPTIGIGAGPYCDGQILVTHDMLGLSGNVSPKFVKRYADLAAQTRGAVGKFKAEVEGKKFPAKEHCY
ncbi:MAG: 3-methyl-2-oxobutanoate hydroxymethyltransferase [Kiritimatiellia bacterium]|nr:3-methyl-2-oxobutanoate hydroxymethyltransferase [Kiritimatiellia bacterium]